MKFQHKPYGIYERIVKRFLDIILSATALILFCWLFAILAILVRIKLGSPVIFTQERPGKIDPQMGKEKIFKLYKFRSMTDRRDEKGELLPGKERMTKFGRIIRAASLDELPELVNILKGDMSIVGPRPLACVYLPYYTDEERVRHTVRPGLTGLAQANGRNNLKWEEKFVYDVTYANKITFAMDCKVILLTLKAVLSHEGIGQGAESPESFHIYRQKQMAAKEERENEG